MISAVPINYRFDLHRKLIRTKCTGDVNPKEVSDHFRDLAQDPNRPDRLNVLLDLTEVTSVPETEQVRAVSHDLKKHQPSMQFNACAIIANSDALFGMMRMFTVFATESFLIAQVFRTTAEAETWLAAQETKPDARA